MNFTPRGSQHPFRFPAICLGLLVMVAGCGGCGSSKKPAGPVKASKVTSKGDNRFVGTIIGMCQPDRLGLDSSPDQVAGLLNRWWISSGETIDPAKALNSQATARIEKDLPTETFERATSERFDERDVEFIRDSQMFREIVNQALAKDGNLQMTLFNWVVLNIELESEANSLAKTPYEIVMFGRGTAEERAWVFAELMRQLRLDTYIIKPHDATESDRWLIAVEDENGLSQLFDPLVGVPIPKSTDGAGETQPEAASLKQLQANENLWKSLYPPNSTGFGELDSNSWDAFVIGTSSLWSVRMQRLQQSISGDTLSAVISQPLPDADREFPFVDSIRLWSFPERRLVARYNTDEPLRYADLWFPFQTPFSIDLAGGTPRPGQDPNEIRKNLQAGRPMRLQLKARNSQIGGDLASAIQQYINVRLQCTRMIELPNVTTEIRRSHAFAFDDAFFWIGICQFELDRPEKAAQTFASYIDQFGDRGSHLEQARLLLAEYGTSSEDRAKHLAAVSENSPAKFQADYQLRMLTDNMPKEKPATTPEESGSSKPSGPAVAEKP